VFSFFFSLLNPLSHLLTPLLVVSCPDAAI